MARLKDLKIGKKIFIGFIVSGLITLLVGYFGLTSMEAINQDARFIFDQSVEPLVTLIFLEEELSEVQLTIAELIAVNAQTEIKGYKDRLDHAEVAMSSHIAQFVERGVNEKGQKPWAEFIDSWENIQRTVPEIIRLVENGQVNEAQRLELNSLRTFGSAAKKNINELVLIEESHAESLNDHIQATYMTVRYEILGLMLLGVVLTCFYGFGFSRAISLPIRKLEEAARNLVEGDTSINLEVKSKDEIGSLTQSFNKMVNHLISSNESIYFEKHKVEIEKTKVEETVRATEEMRQYLSQSVSYMLAEINRFAKGDLTIRLAPEKEGDDIAELYDGFNQALENIRELFVKLREAVQKTVAASHQISEAAEELSTGVQLQSNEASEVASAVEVMTRDIIQNARNASQTAEVAQKNGKVAYEGGKVVDRTVDKIRQIAEHFGKSADKVQKLGASSEQIGEIVETIYDIADQTNLLALNAAIEAARAGEQGRGFAVVADEVRKLAERTTEATMQINGMIKGIQTETSAAVETMQQGNVEVQEGIALADDAGSALQRIVDETQETVNLIKKIAVSSESQSSNSEQILSRVESISSVSEQSAVGVSGIARSVEELNGLMNEVTSFVNEFKVEDNRHSAVI